ncbi:Prolyl oligopeptidase [Pleurostoma richardsiae]|uniref:Dipeptidyl-peptidase V n=1 Tax=Pleurostoma richardsiae TaxID=41990 RepID=A0AA38SD39_9PEZI|nr:Prolyl oligopeptidase [Pleurostoma richardsiae]
MTIQAAKFTPEVLLSAPRRSTGSPNSTGELALYTVSTYSFEEHKKTSQIRVLDIQSGHSTLLFEDLSYSEPTWIGEKEFIFLKSGDKGTTNLLLADVSKPGSSQEIRSFKGGVSNLKVTKLSGGTVALACTALATPAGHMYNPEHDKKQYSTAKVYSSLFARHWDRWVDENSNSIWYGALKKSEDSYTLQEPGLVNALTGSHLKSPVGPFGGTGDFDISSSGIVFVARDPKLSPAVYTKSDLYYIPLSTFTEEKPPVPQVVKTGELRGYSLSPAFSHDGKSVVFTRMKSQQYESDKSRLLLVPDVKDLSNVQEFYKTEDGEGGWDLRPDAVKWSSDDKELYVLAEEKARSKLFKLPASPRHATSLPEVIPTPEGSIAEVRILADDSDKLFASGSSLVDNSFYAIIDPHRKSAELASSNSKQGKSFGLSRSQVDEIWFRGAGEYDVHALVMRPSGFDKSKKYPLAMLIHGGPQGAWGDSWSTRWNPAVFAEQGYVVVCPNPTGSTGYGMNLENGITGDWGGKPYNDLVNCFEYVESNLPYVDTQNAVALGASYGGYMINWIQGHPLGRKFKALVCHDGCFSTLNQYATDELFFPIHDFGGPFYENRDGYAKWDPASFADSWATPELIIHNELDYRLPISEGLAAFNVLQNRGVPSRFVMFPDENHWVLKPENSLVWHKEVLGWINKYSGIDTSGFEEEAEKLTVS